jgi:hypothetical protein
MLQALKEQAKGEKRRRELDRAWRNDFEKFCGLVDIIPKGGTRTKLRLNPIQRKYCTQRSARDVVLKPRQIGFTTMELARDIWTLLTKPGARVVVVVQSLTDHGPLKQISTAIRTMFEGLRASGIEFSFRTESLSEWVLADRDASLRIVEAGASEAAAEKKGRSGTITRLHLTETAFYEYAEATLNALLECVPPPEFGTEIVSESTANGADGVFYQDYSNAKAGRSSYRAQFFSWLDQPEYRTELEPGEVITPETDREREVVAKGATPEQLKWYRRKVVDKKSQDLVDQEYPLDEDTCWLVAGRLFFHLPRTKQLLAAAVDPIAVREVGKEGSFGAFRIWQTPVFGAEYFISVDPSEGIGGDPGAAVVYRRDTGEHVATLHGQFSPWEMARIVAEVGNEYATPMPDGTREGACIVVERNNHGHSVLRALAQEQKCRNVYLGADERPGWVNTEISRATALDGLHDAHFEGAWSSPDRTSLAEMLRFIVNARGKPEAAPGEHDDLVLAHAIMRDVLTRPTVNRQRHEVLDYEETDDA